MNSNDLEDKNQGPQQMQSLLPVPIDNVSRFQFATCHNHSNICVTLRKNYPTAANSKNIS